MKTGECGTNCYIIVALDNYSLVWQEYNGFSETESSLKCARSLIYMYHIVDNFRKGLMFYFK